MKYNWFITLSLFLSITVWSENIAIVPQPNSIKQLGGTFTLTTQSVITFNQPEAQSSAQMLANYLRPATGFPFPIKQGNKGTIALHLIKKPELGKEGYILQSTRQGIIIAAQTPAGLFYGGQTLRQLLPNEIFSSKKIIKKWSVPCVKIEDIPRFKWRGFMLDSARYFFKVDDVKNLLDKMAMHKLNVFHWHLTDDQGWRIEIKKYPNLTKIGAWRKASPVYGGHGNRKLDGKRHGGFYTQKQIRDIVAYAKARHITIVPEIDMPGHMSAAIASYPEFGNKDIPKYNPKVEVRWGVKSYLLAPTEETFTFIENILNEVCELFPSPYIHIGGDEARKTQWNQSKQAKEVLKREGLKNMHQLQSYFIRRVEKMLAKHNRRLIGWDEIRDGGLSPNATVMSWRGTKGGIASAKEGHDVIMAPSGFTYLNFYQNPRNKELKKGVWFEAHGRFLPIQMVYSFNPLLPNTLTPDEQKHILGVQGNLWTEYVKTWDKAEYFIYPRISAIAEIAWTNPENKDIDHFMKRVEIMRKRYKILGLNGFSDPLPEWKKR